uniref:CD99 antigen-like protein 2 n=1 Tax=Sinocyclocheilus rhinocerous TaxID=307959 RepID=A0A673ITK2_9TELE
MRNASVCSSGGISQDLDLADAFDSDELTSPPPKVNPAGGAGGAGEVKPSLKPVKPTVKEPAKHKPKQTDFGDLNLEDALSPDNDIRGKGKDSGKGDKDLGGGGRDEGKPNSRGGTGGSEFSDADLADVGNDNSYKPDKGKGGRGGSSGGHSGSGLDHADDNYDTMAETGTIAGIVSAIAMALAGAVSGYISYQKKKLCFSIQRKDKHIFFVIVPRGLCFSIHSLSCALSLHRESECRYGESRCPRCCSCTGATSSTNSSPASQR